LGKSRVGAHTPACKDIEKVASDARGSKAHGIGSMEAHKDEKDEEQSVAENKDLIGEPTDRPERCQDDKTQGGVGSQTISNLCCGKLFFEQELPWHPGVDHAAHMDRNHDEEAEAQEPVNLVQSVVRHACEQRNDRVLAREGKEERDTGQTQESCAVRIEHEIVIVKEKHGKN